MKRCQSNTYANHGYALCLGDRSQHHSFRWHIFWPFWPPLSQKQKLSTRCISLNYYPHWVLAGYKYKNRMKFVPLTTLNWERIEPCLPHTGSPFLPGWPFMPIHYFCSASQTLRRCWCHWCVINVSMLIVWLIQCRRASSLRGLLPCRLLIEPPMPYNASCGSGFMYFSSICQNKYATQKKIDAISPGGHCHLVVWLLPMYSFSNTLRLLHVYYCPTPTALVCCYPVHLYLYSFPCTTKCMVINIGFRRTWWTRLATPVLRRDRLWLHVWPLSVHIYRIFSTEHNTSF